jgi:hypothetical protein
MKQRLAAVDGALNVIRAQLDEEGINYRSRPSSSTTTARK